MNCLHVVRSHVPVISPGLLRCRDIWKPLVDSAVVAGSVAARAPLSGLGQKAYKEFSEALSVMENMRFHPAVQAKIVRVIMTIKEGIWLPLLIFYLMPLSLCSDACILRHTRRYLTLECCLNIHKLKSVSRLMLHTRMILSYVKIVRWTSIRILGHR